MVSEIIKRKKLKVHFSYDYRFGSDIKGVDPVLNLRSTLDNLLIGLYNSAVLNDKDGFLRYNSEFKTQFPKARDFVDDDIIQDYSAVHNAILLINSFPEVRSNLLRKAEK